MQHHLIGMIFLKVVFMAQGKRDRLSAEQRTDMWCRWKAGESLHEIGRAFGKGHGSIRFLLTQRGGIVPAARRRSPRTLTLAERVLRLAKSPGAILRDSRAFPGTGVFLSIGPGELRAVTLLGNLLEDAKTPTEER